MRMFIICSFLPLNTKMRKQLISISEALDISSHQRNTNKNQAVEMTQTLRDGNGSADRETDLGVRVWYRSTSLQNNLVVSEITRHNNPQPYSTQMSLWKNNHNSCRYRGPKPETTRISIDRRVDIKKKRALGIASIWPAAVTLHSKASSFISRMRGPA